MNAGKTTLSTDSVATKPTATDANEADAAKQKSAQSIESKPAVDGSATPKNTTAESIEVIKSKANGSGSAPKTKKGSLDPKRLPDTDDSIDKVDSKDNAAKPDKSDLDK